MRVTILTGGSTPERAVALAGAGQVAEALRAAGYEVTVVEVSSGPVKPENEEALLGAAVGVEPPSQGELEDLRRAEDLPALMALPELRETDLVFPVLHGLQGEGGRLQSLLELAQIPFVGSGSLGSALAMDKDTAKRLMMHAGVATPRWQPWPCAADAIAALGRPLVVKPSRAGSTVGLTVLERPSDPERLAKAVRLAESFDSIVLLERFVAGRELTCGILDGEALAVGEIVTGGRVFDYHSKYTPGIAREIFPADISPELETEIRELSLRVHRCLRLRHFSRVDFRLDDNGLPLCLEANTLPGMTKTSLLPQSAAAAGIDFTTLCRKIVETAVRRSGGG